MKTRVHVIISGRVQGVWYRASTKQKAEALGLTGWVKNTADGNVEAMFEGDESSVDEMIAWCRKGPPLAQVAEVKVSEKCVGGTCSNFAVLHD
ncbi:MAG TPA: acylphosphatase [Thermoplasmata archaeon]|nr:MAG TPA: acylphosphatase [Thermoplasmata archaeon]